MNACLLVVTELIKFCFTAPQEPSPAPVSRRASDDDSMQEQGHPVREDLVPASRGQDEK